MQRFVSFESGGRSAHSVRSRILWSQKSSSICVDQDGGGVPNDLIGGQSHHDNPRLYS